MNELRWILVGFGIVLLAAIYLWGRRGKSGGRSRTSRRRAVRPEPPMHVHEPDADSHLSSKRSRRLRSTTSTPPAEPPSVEYETHACRSTRGAAGVEPTFADAETAEMPVRPRRQRLRPLLRPRPLRRRCLRAKLRSPGASSVARSCRCGSRWRRNESRARSCWSRCWPSPCSTASTTSSIGCTPTAASSSASRAWSSPAPSTSRRWARRSIPASRCSRSCPVPCRACMRSTS